MRKKVIPKIDYRTKGDPFNYFDGENYNPNGIIFIDDFVYFTYIQHEGTVLIPKEEKERITIELINKDYFDCRTCPVTINGKDSKNNPRINCGKECMFKVHGCSRPVIETKRIRGNKNTLLISRGSLVKNYYDKLGYILRTGGNSGISLHHKNGPYDDRYEQLVYVFDNNHRFIHSSAVKSKTEIVKLKVKLNDLFRAKLTTGVVFIREIDKVKNKIMYLENGIKFLINVEESLEIKQYIEKIDEYRKTFADKYIKKDKKKDAIQDIHYLAI